MGSFVEAVKAQNWAVEPKKKKIHTKFYTERFRHSEVYVGAWDVQKYEQHNDQISLLFSIPSLF
jgi:hypothetical protein